MRPYLIKIKPDSTEEIAVTGRYIRVDDSAVPVVIETRDGQNKVTLSEGNAVKVAPFSGVRISHESASEQIIRLYISDQGEIESSNIAGLVSVDNLAADQGAFTQGRVSLTNANQPLLAANPARRFLMLQNNDAAAVMRFTLDGNPATASNGFRLQPGDSFDLQGYQATGAINAMMESPTGTANNVEFTEG